MKMNKKGFTLIELLAVIVILAIIALIAVPQVLKILNSARKSAAEDSAYGILQSAEKYVATYMMENQGDWNGNIDFTCSKTDGCTGTVKSSSGATSSVTLDFNGTKPDSGKVNLDADGVAKITENLKINGFYCSGSSASVTCSTTSGS